MQAPPPQREGVARFTVEGFKPLARQTIELGRPGAALPPWIPRLFGMEGLDHALHPRPARAGAYPGRARGSERQIILTTHDPLVLDGLALGNNDIRLFTADRTEEGATVIHRVLYTEALRKAEPSGSSFVRAPRRP
jgi:hypothetical protein